ncbi:I hydrophobic transmembrane region and ATP/GTP binding motif [Candidatus Burkholderia pumila]|uniref:I hydrophobic transmembrane region and ATP/GTP binding motif n=1 Tax=Candidatus Burkholderia pumila TaxID=1090375 RepID=A0ABR5HLY0_9BURK|nr:I hydrophobic transmembrane region and ATP/GTP binding motif [Candidatus Burkholderia pumila]
MASPTLSSRPIPPNKRTIAALSTIYVRPLATIEPTVIYFALPVDASIGFKNVDKLVETLLSSRYRNSVVVVAWEHAIVEEAARRIVKQHGGHASSVPRWESADFDNIYVMRLTQRDGGKKPNVSFSVEKRISTIARPRALPIKGAGNRRSTHRVPPRRSTPPARTACGFP